MEGKGKFWETDLTKALEPRLGKSGNAARAPVTVIDVFNSTCAKYGDQPALHVERGGKWINWTWKQYQSDALKCAKAFVKLGLGPRRCVGILGFNSPEWLIANMAAIYAEGVPFGIYTTNAADACHFVLEHSKAQICVVENAAQLAKILEIKDKLPELKAVVQYSERLPDKAPDYVHSWESFLKLGESIPDADVQSKWKSILPGHCATIIYTSGTTGNPKAVMLSHDAMTWTASIVAGKFGVNNEDHIISFLPLSHIAAQMVDIHAPMNFGTRVYFAKPDALKGSLGQTLRDVRPTLFLGVPRVWEKIAEKMQMMASSHSGFKKTIASWAKKKGLKGNMAVQEGKSKPHGWWLANKLVFSKVKEGLGLDRCRMAFSGAAPIQMSTLMYFLSLNIPIYELYGMSESTALCTVSNMGDYRTGTCGKHMEGTDLKIDNPDNDGNGEIMIRGRNVMMGYMEDPESTAKEFDGEGYLRSGDIGKIDSEGFLSITGRIKELIITAGGENVPPLVIEAVVKEEISIISNVMVIGDKRRYLICLITLRSEFDEEGYPTNKLADAVIQELEAAGSKSKTVEEAKKDPIVTQILTEGMDRANKRAISNAQKIRKWLILPLDFSVAGNELGPTMKLKRRVVNKKYQAEIEELYADAAE
eukprot:Opistho-1_new@78237